MTVIVPPPSRMSAAEFRLWGAGGGRRPAEPDYLRGGGLVLDSIGFRAPLAAFSRTTRQA